MDLQIRPGLRWLWRAPGRLQIGLDAAHGVVLEGLTAGDELVLAALETGCDQRSLATRARRAGVAPERLAELLKVLTDAAVMVPRAPRQPPPRLPAPQRRRMSAEANVLGLVYPDGDGWHVLARRGERSVAVVGAARTGTAIAAGLAAAGVGTVLVDDDARVREGDLSPTGLGSQDRGRRRQDAVADLLQRTAPWTRTEVDGRLTPDLVVLLGHGALDPARAEGLLREDVAHLGVLVRERDAVVGPLVLPGHSPCLRCLDLHRRDRDPQWPRLVPQLAAAPEAAEDGVLASLAASVAVAQVLAHLDGTVPAAVGATIEIGLPEGLADVRPWSPHPECGCHWPPPRRPLRRQATMAR